MVKRLSVILILAVFVLAGCSHFPIQIRDDNTKSTLVKIAAKVLAYKFLQKNPDYKEPVKFYCQAVQEGEINQAVIDIAVDYLNDKAEDDIILKSALADLAGLVTVDMSDPAFDLELVKVAATGFMEGIELLETQGG